jgi:hypothetical protein
MTTLYIRQRFAADLPWHGENNPIPVTDGRMDWKVPVPIGEPIEMSISLRYDHGLTEWSDPATVLISAEPPPPPDPSQEQRTLPKPQFSVLGGVENGVGYAYLSWR